MYRRTTLFEEFAQARDLMGVGWGVVKQLGDSRWEEMQRTHLLANSPACTPDTLSCHLVGCWRQLCRGVFSNKGLLQFGCPVVNAESALVATSLSGGQECEVGSPSRFPGQPQSRWSGIVDFHTKNLTRASKYLGLFWSNNVRNTVLQILHINISNVSTERKKEAAYL